MADDEVALLRLWRKKRGEVEPEDLTCNLIVQLGTVTEHLNRHWYERNSGQRSNCHTRSCAPKAARGVMRGFRVIEIFQSERDSRGRALARCFLRLADLDNGLFEQVGRYEAALWRQVRQTTFTLQQLQWRAPGDRYRRTLDRWQRTAFGAADEDRADGR
jgi:hypothetical protein